MGVADAATLDAIEAELRARPRGAAPAERRDRVRRRSGFAIGFQVSMRASRSCCRAKCPTRRAARSCGRSIRSASIGPDAAIRPRSLSHVVYFVPDVLKAEAFYVKRLGFRCTDRFVGAGPFLQPGGHARPPHALLHRRAAVHAGLRAFHFPYRRPDGDDDRRLSLRRQGLSGLLGPGAAQPRLQLVLVFQQPVRLPHRDGRRHGSARRELDAARGGSEGRQFADVPVQVPQEVVPGPGIHENGDYA